MSKIPFKPNLRAVTALYSTIRTEMGLKLKPLESSYFSLEISVAKRNILISYKKHESMAGYICFYCGAHGESKDHVPAVSHAQDYDEYERILVRSCLLCNGFLGCIFLPTLYQRVVYLASRYRKRFSKIISMPHWSEDDIEELSGKLKISIIIGMKKKKDSILRINHLEHLVEILMPDEVD